MPRQRDLNDLASAMTQAASFLSTLPDDSLSLIVRSCSSAPEKDEWQSFIHPDVLRKLVQLMPNTVKSTITHISDCELDEDDSFSSSSYNFRYVSSLLRTVTSIETSSPANAYHIREHAKSLKRLEVHSDFDEEILGFILPRLGNQLTELCTTITSYETAREISERCTQLRELNVQASSTNPEWESETGPHGILALILPGVGQNLRKLESDLYLCQDELAAIRTHCTSLHTLNLTSDCTESNDHASLIASYGGNLRRAFLPDTFTEDDVHEVVSSCPNIEFTVVTDDFATGIFSALGKQVVELDVRNDFDWEPKLEHLLEFLSHCTSLRKCRVHHGHGYDKRLREPFPDLSFLRVLELPQFYLENASFAALAKSTGSLEEVAFNLWFTSYDGGGGMKHLVANNKKLRKVQLRLPLNIEKNYRGFFNNHEEEQELNQLNSDDSGMILSIVRIVSTCKQLHELWLNSNDASGCFAGMDLEFARLREIDNVLTHTLLRRRNVRVRIMEQTYLPVGCSSWL